MIRHIIPFALLICVVVPNQASEHERPHHAIAVLRATAAAQRDVAGTIRFAEQDDGSVVVEGTVTGLEPNSTHGFHIHEYGDLSGPKATTAGGHYAPQGHPHALPPAEKRHAGDLENLPRLRSGKPANRLNYAPLEKLDVLTTLLDFAAVSPAHEAHLRELYAAGDARPFGDTLDLDALEEERAALLADLGLD